MIHYLPLYPAEDRWEGFTHRAILRHLDQSGTPHLSYEPKFLPTDGPGETHFYNATNVLEWRSLQLAELAHMVSYGPQAYDENDVVWLTDLFVPGVEAIAYTNHLLGLAPKIRGCIHAGSFTDHDMMNPVERWAAQHENAVLDIADEVYVGSNWIRDDVIQKRLVDPDKVIVTGFPLDDRLPAPSPEREPIVVFNGRHSPEKQPWLFREIERMAYSGGRVRWIDCLAEDLSKEAYYELLSRAKIVVSFALQETFGTAVQEAVKLGCIPIVPNRCCYVEQFDEAYRYNSLEEAAGMIIGSFIGKLVPPAPLDFSDCVHRWFPRP